MRKKYSILFITHYPRMYGANQSMCQLLVELRRKYNIRPVVLLSQRGEICDFLDQNNIKYYVSHFYWWVNADKGVFQKLLNYRKQIRNLSRFSKINKLIEKEEIDLVYSNSVTINMGFLLSRQFDCPHIWHIRETLQAYNFQYSLPDFFVKKIFDKGADKYIVISDFLSKSYSGFLPENKVARIYNGLSLQDPEINPRNEFKGILEVAVVGIITEQKNQMDALKAIAGLKAEGITNIRLHLVGGNNKEYLRVVEHYISANHIQDDVIIHGHQSNVQSILADMNIGLVCARDEAFGRVTIEYMLRGLPVIASKSGANEELVIDGQNGLLYTLNDVDELIEKLKFFLDNPQRLKKMGVWAKEYVERNFSLEQNADSIYEVIKDLIENR
ncbi:MAG: glycosyltransferase family 4 protein [Paludibacter sp.]|nr:glycosyltransferase family 4 protein [Paludibacter sp.]